MKDTQIITFENETIGTIRGLLDEKGEPWFFAGKVCDCLKIKNSRDAIYKVRHRHNTYQHKVDGVAIRDIVITDSLGRKNKATIINESIFYELIFQSHAQKAFEFQQWVFEEVIPSLRKHGEYRMQGKLIRRSLTDTIKDSGENERMHGHSYSNYSVLVNKSLGLPSKVDRNNLSDEILEKIATRENLIQSMIAEGKTYGEIKAVIENNFSEEVA